MQVLLAFSSSFLLVFALGIQSLNLHKGYRLAAAGTSLVIGIINLYAIKTFGDSTWMQDMAFLLGGPAGIVSSMIIHPKIEEYFK